MAKSKNNGIDPEDMVARYGADTIRLYMMMQSPPYQTLEWNDTAVEGAFRFLRRVWRMVVDHMAAGPVAELVPGGARREPARHLAQDQRDHREGGRRASAVATPSTPRLRRSSRC